MISLVISTYQPRLLTAVKESISHTIGVPYEVIAIDNTGGRRSLCSVYNEGASKAIYNIICFLHEDIVFHTADWGKKVVELFEGEANLGLIGVAGSSYKTMAPGNFNSIDSAHNYYNVLQHYPHQKKETSLLYNKPDDALLPRVVAIDGVWFCAPKKVWSAIRFDEDTFTRFNCYDLDFSLRVSEQYEVAVTFDILLEHYSDGKWDKNWVEETIKFTEKWRGKLPLSIQPLSQQEQDRTELLTSLIFLNAMNLFHFPVSEMKRVMKLSSTMMGFSAQMKLRYRLLKEQLKATIKK